MWNDNAGSSGELNRQDSPNTNRRSESDQQYGVESSSRPRKRPFVSSSSSLNTDYSLPSHCAETPPPESSRLLVDEASLKCPVCLAVFEEPCVTVCGHTFCRSCIVRSLQQYRGRCPQCQRDMPSGMAEVFPNHSLAAVLNYSNTVQQEQRRIAKRIAAGNTQSCSTSKSAVVSSLAEILSDAALDLSTVSRLSDLLDRRRGEIQTQNGQLKTALFQEFLGEMIDRRKQKMLKLETELSVLKSDQESTTEKLNLPEQMQPQAVPETHSVGEDGGLTDLRRPSSVSSCVPATDALLLPTAAPTATPTNARFSRSLSKTRARMVAHFDDLERLYLQRRVKETSGVDSATKNSLDERRTGSEWFCNVLSKITQYSSFRKLASLNYNVEMSTSLSIVSSIEFDRDTEYFSVAGVTKKIKVYEYTSVLDDHVDIHYPISEMQCNSKISGVCWNPYTKSMIASSDYEGVVQLWDAWTSTVTRKYHEHEKRCWTVHFSPVDPYLMATGSDDARVKIWSVNCERSVATIDARVNVCCVHFSPTNRHHLTFGSADHGVHVYDLRNTRRALTVLKGHRKAVAYVRYCNSAEIISASTDSSLRLWGGVDDAGLTGAGLTSPRCTRVMKGHKNEKNFVGLATNGDYVICGSENNRLHVYYKELADPLMSYEFGLDTSLMAAGGGTIRTNSTPSTSFANSGTAAATDNSDFISAICWKKNTNVVIAANSQGMTQVLELI